MLWIALFAQSSAASLYEDYLKNDIRFTFKNRLEEWIVHLNCQVKFGNSFLYGKSDKEIILRNISKDTLNILSNSFSILCWIPDNSDSKIYWIWLNNRTSIKTPIRIWNLHFVDPSIGYELSRNYIYHKYQKKYPIIKSKSLTPTFQEAKNIYKELQNWWPIHNPLFWDINITRLAWRHKTRKSKTVSQRTLSLNIVPYLKSFIERIPDRYYIQDTIIENKWIYTKRINYIICWYNSWLKINWKLISFLIRIKEEIDYPTEWYKSPLSIDLISHKYTLQSWWPKEI